MAAVLLSLVLGLACRLPAARAADDRASSVGLWDVAAVEMNGQEVDAEIAALLQVDYRADGSWAVLFKGLSLVEGTSTNDQEAAPKTFDAETRAGEHSPAQKYLGIYRIDDDARLLCFVEEGKPRPDAFAAPRGSGRLLVRLKRPAHGVRPSAWDWRPIARSRGTGNDDPDCEKRGGDVTIAIQRRRCRCRVPRHGEYVGRRPPACSVSGGGRVAKKLAKVVLLAGGNPQIGKADGAAPVRAYIAAMPGWKREVGRRLDRLICNTIPGVCRSVKWNSPLYGVKGQGYFLGYHCLTKYVKVAFFRGAKLKPMPPGRSKQKDVRYLDIYEDTKLDEHLIADWIRQAAALPGWEP